MLFVCFFRGRPKETFYDLPLDATNGVWSSMAVAHGHSTLHDNIMDLAYMSCAVVRVRIINEREEIIGYGPDPIYRVNYMYSIYQSEVTHVYKGFIDVGNVIDVVQRRRMRRQCAQSTIDHFYEREGITFLVGYIWIPLSVGDDLIMFLRHVYSDRYSSMVDMWRFNGIQGVYRYASDGIGAMHDIQVFDSVNEHNNLTLTIEDLQQISQLWSELRDEAIATP